MATISPSSFVHAPLETVELDEKILFALDNVTPSASGDSLRPLREVTLRVYTPTQTKKFFVAAQRVRD
jgi:hypothetical protein